MSNGWYCGWGSSCDYCTPGTSALITRGSKIVYSLSPAFYYVNTTDGKWQYGLEVFGEEPTIHMQTTSIMKIIFTLHIERDESGSWKDATQDEGDLMGITWTTVEDIDGTSHDLPVQGSNIVRIPMGDGWADVVLEASGNDAQVVQVVAFSDDLRPDMADFLESMGISGDLMDTVLGGGVPVADTPFSFGFHAAEPTFIPAN